jgi:hypothetical protein
MPKVTIEGKEVDLDTLAPEQLSSLKDRYSEAFLPEVKEVKKVAKKGKK